MIGQNTPTYVAFRVGDTIAGVRTEKLIKVVGYDYDSDSYVLEDCNVTYELHFLMIDELYRLW